MSTDTLGKFTGLVRALPRSIKLGLAIVAIGLGMDAWVHLFVGQHAHDTVAGFSLPEHLSHLIVLVGMLVVLGAVLVEGMRISAEAKRTHERGGSNALR